MLQEPPQPPPLFNGTPNSIINDARRLIEHSREVQDEIVRNVQPDEANFVRVLLPMAHAENALHVESNVLCFYKEVSTDSKLRDASGEAQKLLDDFAIESAMREDLFGLVDAVLQKKEDLDVESSQLLDKQHKEYLRNGLKIPAGSVRDRFKDIQQQLSQLKVDFRKNQNGDNGGTWFLPHELEGIPEDLVLGLEKGVGENTGKLRLTFEYPHYIPATQYAKSSETRKRMTLGFQNKCADNVPIFKEIMILRDESARLLGYPNHAAFRIEEKMAKTPEMVNMFLNDLRSRLVPGGLRELESLKQLKKADLESRGEPSDDRFFLWDSGLYQELLLKKEYSVDRQKIAEYFPLQTTIEGMLEIFQDLFGLVFMEITNDEWDKLSASRKGGDIVWHEDVQILSVWDDEEQGGRFLGYLYLDLFPRKDKFGGMANFNIQPGFLREDGTRQYPATALICNFTKPTPNKPSLLKHYETVLLFHELGHGIHDLVSKTLYSRFHGTMTVIDFGEAPSQMLEHWCWTPSTLKSLSRHYSTLSPQYLKSWKDQAMGQPQPPEKLPDDQIESIIRAKHVNGTLMNLRKLHMSIFDMVIHEPESHESIENMNISAQYNRLRKDLLQMDGPEVLGEGDEWGHGHASLGHVISEYDAGLYGYLFSQVFADDIFYTVFKDDHMDSKEGLRYRYEVLEKGGSQDEMKTVSDFLSRAPKTEAFYMELGLVS